MTDPVEIANIFIDLFRGRTDAYGTWGGGKTDSDDGDAPMAWHVMHGPHIGVYCITDDNTVGWGCIDIDGKDHPIECGECADGKVMGPEWEDWDRQAPEDCGACSGAGATWDWDEMWAIAAQLQDALAYKDVVGWTERTANGIHLWVFPEARVPAATMRRALLAACEVIGYRPKECNPKQEEINPDKPYGNYVRLPYYGYYKHGMPKDRFVIDDNGPMALEDFALSAHGSRASVATLKSMAALYTPPAPSTVNVDTTVGNIEYLVPILPPVVKMIWEDGPLDGDRSGAYVKAAVILRDAGWQAQGIYTVVDALDRRLGKFTDPRYDGKREELLLDIVEKYGVGSAPTRTEHADAEPF